MWTTQPSSVPLDSNTTSGENPAARIFQLANRSLLATIRVLHQESRQTYGRPSIWRTIRKHRHFFKVFTQDPSPIHIATRPSNFSL